MDWVNLWTPIEQMIDNSSAVVEPPACGDKGEDAPDPRLQRAAADPAQQRAIPGGDAAQRRP